MKTLEDAIKTKVKKVQDMESKLLVLEHNLAKNTEFKEFLKLQKSVNEKSAVAWAEIERLMIENDTKKIDADFVLLTIVAKKNLEVDEDKLSDDFMKIVPDTKKINAYIKENKKTPKGVKQVDAPYLRKTFRGYIS